MIRVSYWGSFGLRHWRWFGTNLHTEGRAFHVGPFTITITTDRLP